MKKTILFLCFGYLVGVTYAQEPFRVMFYNVENFVRLSARHVEK